MDTPISARSALSDTHTQAAAPAAQTAVPTYLWEYFHFLPFLSSPQTVTGWRRGALPGTAANSLPLPLTHLLPPLLSDLVRSE